MLPSTEHLGRQASDISFWTLKTLHLESLHFHHKQGIPGHLSIHCMSKWNTKACSLGLKLSLQYITYQTFRKLSIQSGNSRGERDSGLNPISHLKIWKCTSNVHREGWFLSGLAAPLFALSLVPGWEIDETTQHPAVLCISRTHGVPWQ